MTHRSLLLACLCCALSSCPTTSPEPEPIDQPVVIELSPTIDQQDFFWEDDLFVRFDRAPDSLELTLVDAGGAAQAGLLEISEDGTSGTLNPDQRLEPSSEYLLTVTFEPSVGPIEVPFRTSAHGTPLGDAAAGLADRVYAFDLSEAVFEEPAGLAGVLESELDEANVLIGFTAESSTDAGEQPGLHFLTAVGIDEDGDVVQDPCARTLGLTWGPDGAAETDDDVPAWWDDPRVQMGPRDLVFGVEEFTATVTEFLLEGTVHPELGDIRGITMAGNIDTRALDPLFNSEGETGIVCEMLEAAGLDCEECGADEPGAFCVAARAHHLSAVWLEDHPPLVHRTCADVLDHFAATGECAEGVVRWDADEDGVYELCPAWSG